MRVEATELPIALLLADRQPGPPLEIGRTRECGSRILGEGALFAWSPDFLPFSILFHVLRCT